MEGRLPLLMLEQRQRFRRYGRYSYAGSVRKTSLTDDGIKDRQLDAREQVGAAAGRQRRPVHYRPARRYPGRRHPCALSNSMTSSGLIIKTLIAAGVEI